MELEKITIQDFKKLKRVDLPLSNINVIVGANGSGKSSVIQGLHLACCCLRQASTVRKDRSSVIPIEELDYLPTDSYNELGHGEKWGNKEGSNKSSFGLFFRNIQSAQEVDVSCSIRAARNKGISVFGNIPQEVSSQMRKDYFTAYIPGISGIPNEEEKRAERVVKRASSFGDSNVFLRNILLIISQLGRLREIEQLVSQVIAPHNISIEVKYDERKDLVINCIVSINGSAYPIELVGTGYLQLIQIFSYIFLFNPKLLLIDEPDNHLHPSIQERLLPVLNDAARNYGFKVILATHSPFIVRSAPASSKVFWFDNGQIQATDRSAVEIALGWGAFGKKIILFTEDNKTHYLRKILNQKPHVESMVSLVPGIGIKGLPSPEQAKHISGALGNMYTIVVYRDGDALTESERSELQKRYEAEGIKLLISKYKDIEAYFCDSCIISDATGFRKEIADAIYSKALEKNENQSKQEFLSQRSAHNSELYKQGGSPISEAIWQELQSANPLYRIKGKTVLKSIIDICKKQYNLPQFSENCIMDCKYSMVIAKDLFDFLEQLT